MADLSLAEVTNATPASDAEGIVVRPVGINVTATVDNGVAITGQSLESGGSGALGWLSSLRKVLTDRLPPALSNGFFKVSLKETSVTQPVSGPVTDVQLRAAAVPVSDGGATLSIDDGGSSITVDGSVAIGSALPAGTNNIGDVDIVTLPSATLTLTSDGQEAKTVGTVAVTLGSVPAGAHHALIYVGGTAGEALRFKIGAAPTSTAGVVVVVGDYIDLSDMLTDYRGFLTGVQFIRKSTNASDILLDIEYFI